MIAPPRQPAQDELEALIKEARARHLRRRLLGAAAVAIAAALGLGIYAIALGGNTDGTTGDSPNVPASAPLCRSSQLSATADGLSGGAFGTMNGPATLTNIGASACSLPTGRPRAQILWRGRILPTQDVAESADDPSPRVLAPHSKAYVALEWANWCGKPREGTVSRMRPTFLLRFADGLELDAPGWVATAPGCLSPGKPSTLAVSRPYRPLSLTR